MCLAFVQARAGFCHPLPRRGTVDGMRTTARDRIWGTAAVLVVFGLPACASGGWPKDHPDLAQRARQSPGSFVQPARDQWNHAQTLQANYSMRVTRGVGGRSFDAHITVQRPDRIDILLLAPTGLTEAYVRANEREVGLFVREDMVLYSGPSTRDAFERALGFALSAPDAVAVLMGYGVEPTGLPTGLPSWDPRLRRVRIDHGPSVSLWLHPLTLRFDRVEHHSGQSRVTTVVEGWVQASAGAAKEKPVAGAAGLEVQSLAPEVATVPIPSLLKLEVEPEGYGIRLRMVGEPVLNHQYPPEYFDLQRLPGVLELPLSELARDGGLFSPTSEESPVPEGV